MPPASTYWLVIPDPAADNHFGGIIARVDGEDHVRALELVGGYPIVAMRGSNGEGPTLGFFRLEEVEQALRDGWAL